MKSLSSEAVAGGSVAQVRAFPKRTRCPGQFASREHQRVELVITRQRGNRSHHAGSAMAPLGPDETALLAEGPVALGRPVSVLALANRGGRQCRRGPGEEPARRKEVRAARECGEHPGQSVR